MPATRTACPACRTPLRFRESDPIAMPFDCPECGASLGRNAAGELIPAGEVMVEPEPAATVPVQPRARDLDASSILDAAPNVTPVRAIDTLDATPRDVSGEAENGPMEAEPRRAALDRLRTPAGIAWATATVAALALVVALVVSAGRPPIGASDRETSASTGDNGTGDVDPLVPVDVQRERLLALAARLGTYRTREGRLPAGATIETLPLRERLSWIARLEASGPLGTAEPPNWERSYRDPANAEFVQRPRPAFLNPSVEATRDPDGYPATHYGGVGGVGGDAPGLPAEHSRAGMFGTGRAASPDDVADGMSNTMMLAGVSTRLGSWAAGGTGTVRPFTEEPYVDGPDGFGDEGGMLVMMGDGSIRTIAAATDPRIVRRMAAMHDGLDLELARPGEPGDRPSVEPEPPPVAVVDPPDSPASSEDEEPPDANVEPPPEIALPELPSWTPELVAVKLAQPIDGLRTRRPVAAGVLLEEVADMVGVPIHLKVEDGIDQSFLDEPVSLVVEKGTVGDALDALLAKLDLRYVVEADGLRLKPKSEE